MLQSKKVPFSVKDKHFYAEKTEKEISGLNSRTGKKQSSGKNKRNDFNLHHKYLFLLSTKHVLPADLEPVRPISFFHISCFCLFFGLCWLCMFVLVFLSLFPLCCFLFHLSSFSWSFVFLSHFIPATFPSLSLLSSFCPFHPTYSLFFHLALTLMFFFSSLDVALCWFSFIQREREGGRGRVTFINNEAWLARQVRHSLTLR